MLQVVSHHWNLSGAYGKKKKKQNNFWNGSLCKSKDEAKDLAN